MTKPPEFTHQDDSRDLLRASGYTLLNGKGWRAWSILVTYGTQVPLEVLAIQYDDRNEWEILVNGAPRQTLREPPGLSMPTLVDKLHDGEYLKGGLFEHRQEKGYL